MALCPWPSLTTVVYGKLLLDYSWSLQCLQKEMTTNRHRSVYLWWDQNDAWHCRLDSCQLMILNGVLSQLHSAAGEAVSWLINYGTFWHLMQTSKRSWADECPQWVTVEVLYDDCYTGLWFCTTDRGLDGLVPPQYLTCCTNVACHQSAANEQTPFLTITQHKCASLLNK